ncbi:uncharacterized protein METZ01_LOCUS283713, partial [marine metagenome]
VKQLGRLISYIRNRFFFNRKKGYLRKIEKDTSPIPGQLPKRMSLPSIRGKSNDYTFIEELKDNFVDSKEPYSLGVSIVVPVYNRKEILTKTLAGILNQTYPPDLIETIVADDGSSDGVEELIPEYEKLMNIKYVKQKDQGYRLS